ncbi:hypothetical protein G5I_12203 [Acromyrmex echinatior]|uniref:Uncharacterized protein n=1 Tax=Acromyrmex echinatior TaxID=103372 RepID=F4X1N5_ACREC|nr:hypothetical protein G5I_12203 [Acromyrmex echinatior]
MPVGVCIVSCVGTVMGTAKRCGIGVSTDSRVRIFGTRLVLRVGFLGGSLARSDLLTRPVGGSVPATDGPTAYYSVGMAKGWTRSVQASSSSESHR